MARDELEQLSDEELTALVALARERARGESPPSRRDVVKAGGALGVGALLGGGAASAIDTASAATNEAGEIGTSAQPLDLHAEEVFHTDISSTPTDSEYASGETAIYTSAGKVFKRAYGGSETQLGSTGAVETIRYEPGHTLWTDGLTDVEVKRIVPPSGTAAHISAIAFRQKGGGSSANVSVDIYDAGAASELVQVTLGSADRTGYTAGTDNTVLLRISNSSGSDVNGEPIVRGEFV